MASDVVNVLFWFEHLRASQVTKADEEKHNPSTEKGYYLSTVWGPKKQGLIITLHKVAGCHRRPGLELRNAIFKEDVDESDFTYKCKDCYPELNLRRKPASKESAVELGRISPNNVCNLGDDSVSSSSEVESGSSSDEAANETERTKADGSRKKGQAQ